MRTKHWIILFAALVLLSAVVYVVMGAMTREEKIASVYQDGELVHTVDLDAVTEEYRFTVQGEEGQENEILVRPGQISVSAASCPDQICVDHGAISDGVEPIVCLPHRVVVQIEKSSADGADTSVGG